MVKLNYGGESMSGVKGMAHRLWSKDEKLEIINKHLIAKIPMTQVAKEYGISTGQLSNWIKKYLEDGETALEKRSGNPYAALHTSKSLSELERLRLTVAKQEVEIARLKKGYFVKGVGANKEYVTGKEKTMK